jgi:TonB family protein
MLRLLLLLLAFTSLLATASAQQRVAPQKEYLDSLFTVLPSALGAQYYRETVRTDSLAGEVKDYYLSGKLQSNGTFDDVHELVPNGTLETWCEGGGLESRSTYMHGTPVELWYYYGNGQLKRHERYTGEKRTLAQCFAKDGQPITFFEYSIMPVYPEGNGEEAAIVNAIVRKLVYPKSALKSKITGRVLLRFVVTPTGGITHVEVKESAHPDLNAAAVAALLKLKRFKPGQEDGKPVAVHFEVPLNFTIK